LGVTGFELDVRFPGQYRDAETGLFYNTFRDYDPQTGRYVQSDPIGLAGGANPYLYVGARPLDRLDPRGTLRNSGCGGLNLSSPETAFVESALRWPDLPRPSVRAASDFGNHLSTLVMLSFFLCVETGARNDSALGSRHLRS